MNNSEKLIFEQMNFAQSMIEIGTTKEDTELLISIVKTGVQISNDRYVSNLLNKLITYFANESQKSQADILQLISEIRQELTR